ncbi:MAG: lysophospholipase [Alphaproteobacteria bacterium]
MSNVIASACHSDRSEEFFKILRFVQYDKKLSGLLRRLCLLAMTGIFVASCTPKEQPFNDIPSHEVVMREDVFIASDGAKLPYRKWLPNGKPKAVVLALHGFNDYSKAFEGAGEYLSARRIAVYAYDQRGFGKTEHTGIWAGEKNYISDVKQWVEHLARRHKSTPIYIMGESMGGAVAVLASAQPDFPEVAGVILVAPALWGGDAFNPLYRLSIIFSAHTFPYYELTGRGLKIQASDNIEMLKAMSKDPLIIKSTRVDAVYGVVNLMDAAYEAIPQGKTPILFLYGEMDQVIPPVAMRNALPRFLAPVYCISYPQGYHMLLRDLNGAERMRNINDWIGKKAKNAQISDCIV